RKKMVIALTAVICSFIVYGSLVGAASSDNVIVASVNYVDQKFNQLMQRINQVEAKVGTGSGTGTPTYPGQQPTQPINSEALTKLEEKVDLIERTMKSYYQPMLISISESNKYSVIVLEKGQSLIASDVVEFIVRGGTCTAISGANGDGLADMTSGDGKDYQTGEQLPKNHYMLISRGDGRGIKAESDTVYLMVKGSYAIYLPEK
ncbi:MAG TPA: hypothetical protein DDZ89_05095, partial [Clostridiales bacterium]|nr:hypothetical protein [Clostridiales bacterium]